MLFRAGRYAVLLRQWIAAGAICALTFHLVLSALALGHSTLWRAGTDGDAFVICHGAGSSPGQNEPVNLPPQQSHCVLCTLVHSAGGVLPSAAAVSLDAIAFSRLPAPRRAQVMAYHSPTGEYQRGPPPYDFIAG